MTNHDSGLGVVECWSRSDATRCTMPHWFIVSAPGGMNKKELLRDVKGICSSEDSLCADFPVPELKVVRDLKSWFAGLLTAVRRKTCHR